MDVENSRRELTEEEQVTAGRTFEEDEKYLSLAEQSTEDLEHEIILTLTSLYPRLRTKQDEQETNINEFYLRKMLERNQRLLSRYDEVLAEEREENLNLIFTHKTALEKETIRSQLQLKVRVIQEVNEIALLLTDIHLASYHRAIYWRFEHPRDDWPNNILVYLMSDEEISRRGSVTHAYNQTKGKLPFDVS